MLVSDYSDYSRASSKRHQKLSDVMVSSSSKGSRKALESDASKKSVSSRASSKKQPKPVVDEEEDVVYEYEEVVYEEEEEVLSD